MKRIEALALMMIMAAAAFGQTAVWELTRNGKTLYLGGSIHRLREQDLPLPPEFAWALEHSVMLVLEADIEKISAPRFSQSLMPRMLARSPLDQVLSPEVYRRLEEHCARTGLPLAQLNRLKPTAAASSISMTVIQKLEFVQPGVDWILYKQARSEGKRLDFLETVEFQISLVVDAGEGYEDEIILDVLRDYDRIGDKLISLVREWRRGKSIHMDRDLTETKEETPSWYRAMYADRNNAWLPKIEAFLETEEIEFVLVGYGHIQGPDGLLKMFRERGVEVTQLRIPGTED